MGPVGGLVGVNVGEVDALNRTMAAVVSDCYSIVLGDSRVSGLLVDQNGELKSEDVLPGPWDGHIINYYASCDGSRMVESSGLVGKCSRGSLELLLGCLSLWIGR